MRNQLVRIDPNHTISGYYEMNNFTPPPFFFSLPFFFLKRNKEITVYSSL
uniref:ORF49d n=1 Tax=Pinus koraiensis TaxID=88728 RepID=Q85X41_PINKO|nr:ORF49d [Pinus koraiensis]AAO74022.1 ORF49d [Pinus koraiensis]